MRLALISYEFAGVAGSGGIGTYVRNAAAMLSSQGHQVEVFTGSQQGAGDETLEFPVHSVVCSREEFRDKIVPRFAARHEVRPFDVIEGPEYKAEAAGICAAFPDLALVVRVHGPTFTIDESNHRYVPWYSKARYYVGALRRGRLPNRPWEYIPENDPERTHALAADEVMANSRATADRIRQVWNVQPERLSAVPLVFNPPARLLELESNSRNGKVLFLGRLEVRKGVLELAKAIPLILRRLPSVKFKFVGRVLPHPRDRKPLDQHILGIVKNHTASVELNGEVAYSEVPRFLGDSDICVFPSDWEASGFVCMEAMAAARAVVGSAAGGMAEIIEHGRTGLLVPPRSPHAIANAVVALLGDQKRRVGMGQAAREEVTSAYSPDKIGPLQEAIYQRAIERARSRHYSRRIQEVTR